MQFVALAKTGVTFVKRFATESAFRKQVHQRLKTAGDRYWWARVAMPEAVAILTFAYFYLAGDSLGDSIGKAFFGFMLVALAVSAIPLLTLYALPVLLVLGIGRAIIPLGDSVEKEPDLAYAASKGKGTDEVGQNAEQQAATTSEETVTNSDGGNEQLQPVAPTPPIVERDALDDEAALTVRSILAMASGAANPDFSPQAVEAMLNGIAGDTFVDWSAAWTEDPSKPFGQQILDFMTKSKRDLTPVTDPEEIKRLWGWVSKENELHAERHALLKEIEKNDDIRAIASEEALRQLDLLEYWDNYEHERHYAGYGRSAIGEHVVVGEVIRDYVKKVGSNEALKAFVFLRDERVPSIINDAFTGTMLEEKLLLEKVTRAHIQRHKAYFESLEKQLEFLRAQATALKTVHAAVRKSLSDHK